MSNTRDQDFLQECMSSMPQKADVETFELAFCNVCLNGECYRSAWTESKWLTRMLMQEKSLNDPVFALPDNPLFIHLNKTQNFEDISPDTLNYYGGWVEVKQDGSVLHNVPAKPEITSATKVDKALESLQSGKPPQKTEHTPPIEDLKKPEPEGLEEDTIPDPVEEIQDVFVPDIKPERPVLTNVAGPKKGILLRAPDPSKAPTLAKDLDPWASPEPSGVSKRNSQGKLVVRVSDGKVIQD
jgi:hypothetical protein